MIQKLSASCPLPCKFKKMLILSFVQFSSTLPRTACHLLPQSGNLGHKPFSLKPVFAHAGQESSFLLFVRRRSAMVRKGWTKVEVPYGWLQVIRGKRPPSDAMISAARSSDWEGSTGVEKLAKAASARIQRIQVSLGALQPEDKEEPQALLTALEKAIRQAEVPSMEQQIHATEEYLARAKKRLLQHDATIAAAREALLKAEHDKEVDVQGVADGEDLLRKLKTQAADPILPMPIADPVGEVARFQQVVADLQRQLHQHGAPVVPTQGVSAVPSFPLLFALGRGRTMCQKRNTRWLSG